MKVEILTFQLYAERKKISVKTVYNRYKAGTLLEEVILIGKQPHIVIYTKP
jgi:hypothetical protein